MRIWSVAFLLVIAACSEAVENTTTTSEAATTTSTQATQQIVDGGLIPMDPPTLIPFEDAEPVVVGHRHQGVLSPDRSLAAVLTEGSPGGDASISIVDMGSLETQLTIKASGDGLAIDNRGHVFLFDSETLREFDRDGATNDRGGPQTPVWLASTLEALPGDGVAYLSSPAGLITVEVETSTGIDSFQTELATSETFVPDVAWSSNIAYVVDSDSDQVVEVDMTSGELSAHNFDGEVMTSPDGVTRDIALASSGKLFIATTITTTDDAGTTVTPQKLVVVDTTEWSSMFVDVNVSSLTLSPAGEVIAALGSVTAANGTVSQSPIYLIDTETGDALVGFQGNSGTVVDVQFSADGAQMYVVSQSEVGTKIDIIDVGLQELVGNVAFTRISLVGEAGLMAFHSTID